MALGFIINCIFKPLVINNYCNKTFMQASFLKKSAFLFVPLGGITLWFLKDGGISYGLNFLYYWFFMIGYQIFFILIVWMRLLYLRYNHKKDAAYQPLLYLSILLLMASIVYFVAFFEWYERNEVSFIVFIE